MIMRGDDIKRLIPQREPFMMIDECEAVDENTAHTRLTVLSENYFILPDQTMAESGLVEHIAQSAAALVGYQSLADNHPRIGLIGEIKHFECIRRPMLNETIDTTIQFGFSFGNVTIAQGECRINGETIAKANLKIFMQ